jgi:hypothetical protein
MIIPNRKSSTGTYSCGAALDAPVNKTVRETHRARSVIMNNKMAYDFEKIPLFQPSKCWRYFA